MAGVLLGLSALATPAPVAHATDTPLLDCTTLSDEQAPSTAVAQQSLPLSEMRILDADTYLRQRGVFPGTGVTVAVLDSGIASTPSIDVDRDLSRSFTKLTGKPLSYHGTAVAGLISGLPSHHKLIGIAPRATLIDLRVYDTEQPDTSSGQVGVTGSAVDDALQYVLDLINTGHRIDIVNISLGFDADPRAGSLVNRLWSRGVIVVAASGDRMGMDYLGDTFETYQGSEDVADRVFPAGYPHALAVNATALGVSTDTGDSSSPSPSPTASASVAVQQPDVTQWVLANSATDVAAPTAGAISYGPLGDVCELTVPSTSWSAAEVTGILAMLKSAHLTENNLQLVARLEQTASGLPGSPTEFVGVGVVQPYDALTRPLKLGETGAPPASPPPKTRRAAVADAPPDPLGHTRHNVVWWALGGAGSMALTLLLAPVLSRRRTRA